MGSNETNETYRLTAIGNSIAGIIGKELGWPNAVAPKAKSALPAPLAGTVTSSIFSVPFAPPHARPQPCTCPAERLDVLPSSALTAKNGSCSRPRTTFIHMLLRHRNQHFGACQLCVNAPAPLGCDWFNQDCSSV